MYAAAALSTVANLVSRAYERLILERKTMAAPAILSGKMKVDGDKMTLLRHTGASRSLVHCTASLDTDFS